MKITHHPGREIKATGEAMDPAIGECETLWRYAYGPDLAPKPFLHPVAIPGGGVFTAFRPTDHMWHRGLWFTWKFLNGANYWEEGQEPEGHQETVGGPDVSVEGAGRAVTISSRLEWKDRGEAILQEERRIRFEREDGVLIIDWETRQAAARDLLIDRTPYTTWGGYGGLVIRAAQSLRDQKLLFPGGAESEYVAGEPHRWCDLSGRMDGGPDRFGGIAFLDHPANPRHPTPFYARTRVMDNFMNAAILFHVPLPLSEGEALWLRYRVLLHAGRLDADEIDRRWDDYADNGS